MRQPPRAMRQPPYHPAEAMSDSPPAEHEVAELGNGSLALYAPGSIPDQLGMRAIPLSHATSSGTAATRNAAAYGSFGAAPEGQHEQAHVGVPQR
jgi:hypothetical protein